MENSVEQEKRKVPVIEVDEGQPRAHVSEVVRQSVEETLNGLLGAVRRSVTASVFFQVKSGSSRPKCP